VENCVENEKDLVESNLDFIREVPMIHVNFIVIVVTVCERKKIGGITFVPPLVILGSNESPVYILPWQPTGKIRISISGRRNNFFSSPKRPDRSGTHPASY
jgi:hypothetical protein